LSARRLYQGLVRRDMFLVHAHLKAAQLAEAEVKIEEVGDQLLYLCMMHCDKADKKFRHIADPSSLPYPQMDTMIKDYLAEY
jgi:hypothetical protein